MKRLITWAIAIAGYTLTAAAQTALPYGNGFDTPAENDDWVLYREGIGDDEGFTHTWEPMPSDGAVSAPNMLFHDYPVGYGGEELTDDWLVSDKLDLSDGGKLSMKLWIYTVFGGLSAGDTIEVYLLQGSRYPGTATKTKLASLGSKFVNSGSISMPEWTDTTGINIPPATGDAYLAFRYTNIFDWFTVGIDDLKITPGASTAIEAPGNKEAVITLYPNPAQTHIYWETISGAEKQPDGVLLNLSGQAIRTFPATAAGLDIRDLVPGFYMLRIGSSTASFIKK